MKISEQFYSIQGEGYHTGVPSYFIRFFGCSLQCQGFGQKNPADPTTWVQPWKTIDIKSIDKIEDLPEQVYEYGCDSVYSWSAKFKHLQHEMTVEEVVEKMKQDLGDKFDLLLLGKIHLIFTGGEPLMKFNQTAMAEIINHLIHDYDARLSVTIETNGTQFMDKELENVFLVLPIELTISCSPKLLHTSGEQPEKAIKPDVVESLMTIADFRILKFVVSNTDEAKSELLETVKIMTDCTLFEPFVYLMPEGPNKHRVEDSSTAIAEFAIRHGYRFSDRLHARLWDNKIGV